MSAEDFTRDLGNAIRLGLYAGNTTYTGIGSPHNFNATTDPGVSNDNTQGYGVGSLWFNTTAGQLRAWECRSAATGAAAWVFSGADYANGGTNPPTEGTMFGSGSGVMLAEGNIYRYADGTGVQAAATGADKVVLAYTLPANSLDGTGFRGFVASFSGNKANNANTITAKIIFGPASATVGQTVGAGGVVIATTGATATAGGVGWMIQGQVFKYGAANSNTQITQEVATVVGTTHGGVGLATAATATENAGIPIAFTINAATATTDATGFFAEINAMN